jgi:alpha-beta hydrolase superfamily lysophospholipase
MKKIIYIIPGLGESCKEKRYEKLAEALRAKNYKVNCIDPNWYLPISGQIFRVEKDAIVCGFSFGAVIAYLIAKKYPYRKAIFASISPLHKFSFKSLEKDLMAHMSRSKASAITEDAKNIKISLKSLKIPYVTLAGELEKGMPADFIVPKTGHVMTNAYINCIQNLV